MGESDELLAAEQEPSPEIADTVRLAMLERMQELEERAQRISERINNLTPPPQAPE
jgi:hypothetical protein